MAGSMSNSFALLGANDGFQQVPSKKNRKKKNKTQDQMPAVETPLNPSSSPSDMSEDTAGAPTEAFQQVLMVAVLGNDQQRIQRYIC